MPISGGRLVQPSLGSAVGALKDTPNVSNLMITLTHQT